MNTPVNFELAKLLKEKGFDKPQLKFYFEDGDFSENVFKDTVGMDYGSSFQVEFSELIENWNDKWLTKKNGNRCFGCDKSKGYFETFSAPTIAEVVYWIYSKYDIWISLIPDSSSGHKLLDRKFSVSIFRFNINLNVQAEILRKDKNILYFNLPENAFEYTIEYILNTYKPTS